MKHISFKVSAVLILFVSLNANSYSQWVKTNWPASADTTFTVHLALDGSALYAGTTAGAFRTMNDGLSWTDINNGLPREYVNAMVIFMGGLYVGTDGAGGLFRTSDDGGSWTNLNVTNTGVNAVFVSNSTILAGTGLNGLKVSTDNGSTWSTVAGHGSTSVWAFANIGTNWFAGTDGEGVLLSKDNGATWSAVNSGLGNLHIQSFLVQGTTLYVTTAGGSGAGVYVSKSYGSNWTKVSNGLPADYVFGLAASGSNLFAAVGAASTTKGGIYCSTNNGSNWTAVNTGMTGIESAGAPCVAASSANLFTGGAGVWKRPLSDFSTAGVSHNSLGSGSVEVYPNPTTGAVTLRGAGAGQQDIRISNMLGETIMRNTEQATGDLRLDLSSLPTGTYFLECNMRGSVARKMIVKQ